MEHLGRPLPEDRDSYYADIEDNKNNDNKISQAKDIAALIGQQNQPTNQPTKTSNKNQQRPSNINAGYSI